jgi:hypothetical protein
MDTKACFTEKTLDGQLYEIYLAAQSGGGGGGAFGAVYYFNRSNVSSISGYYEMSKNLVIGAGTTLTATGAGTQLVGSFATVLNDPNITTIPSGNWNFENYISMSSNGGTPKIYGEIYSRNLAGTETLIATNISNPHPITDGTVNELYLWSIPVPATNILATDRIVVKFYAINLGGKTMTMHFENSNIAQAATSLPSVDLSAYVLKAGDTMTGQLVVASTGIKFNDTTVQTTAAVTSVSATSPITSSGGATPVISTSMATNKLLGRSTAGTGVAEEISIGTGLSLAGGTLSNTGVLSDTAAAQGGTQLLNMVQITSAAYSAIVTPTANTLYIIVG